jgi:hypothetical protein
VVWNTKICEKSEMPMADNLTLVEFKSEEQNYITITCQITTTICQYVQFITTCFGQLAHLEVKALLGRLVKVL